MPALLQSRAHEIFTGVCAACHGNDLKGGSAASLFTSAFLEANSDAQIVTAVTSGPSGVANHGFKTMFTPEEIAQLPAYLRIRGGILNRHVGPVPDITGKVFTSEKAKFKVETLAKGLRTK